MEAGWRDYHKRLPRELALTVRELPLAPRPKNGSPADAIRREGEQILNAVPPAVQLVALDVGGESFCTEQLAHRLASWKASGLDLAFVIGGPDGLSDTVRNAAALRWSLSPLTLPHPLVRVMLIEQIYRAHTILCGHPYHK